MNIFYLDDNPRIAAEMQCDVHVVKMILESAQLLCTAHHELGTGSADMYKPTHKNHPSAVWCRSSVRNYRWLWTHFKYLCEEYTYRYGKEHKSARLLSILHTPPAISATKFTPPTLAMPDEYKDSDAVKAYRSYYASKQESMGRPMRWTRRNKPSFI